MNEAKLVSTPLGSHFKLSKEQSPKTEEERDHMSKVPYASAIGSLMYAMVCTRPDIAHAEFQPHFEPPLPPPFPVPLQEHPLTSSRLPHHPIPQYLRPETTWLYALLLPILLLHLWRSQRMWRQGRILVS